MRPKKILELAREFLINSQWKISLIILIALGFLFLKQTNYFEPFFSIPLLAIFLLLWIFSILLFHLKPAFSLCLTILFFLLAAWLFLVDIKPWAERAALYAYGFLVIGLAQELIIEVAVNGRRKKV